MQQIRSMNDHLSSNDIHIKEVLADMDRLTGEDSHLHIFSIEWVRHNNSSGGPRGSIKRVERASKYTKPAKRHQKRATGTWQFKQYNTIPIQDRDNDKLVTPKITHIIKYNDRKVIHYGT